MSFCLWVLKIRILFLFERFINKSMTFRCDYFGWVCFHEFYVISICKEQFGNFLPLELLTHFAIRERLFDILVLLRDSVTLFQGHLIFYSSRDQIGGL